MFSACETEENQSSEKAITAFTFTSPAAEGTISGMVIAITLFRQVSAQQRYD
jgi:hypothetical protein